jgi:hypothetical protein
VAQVGLEPAVVNIAVRRRGAAEPLALAGDECILLAVAVRLGQLPLAVERRGLLSALVAGAVRHDHHRSEERRVGKECM